MPTNHARTRVSWQMPIRSHAVLDPRNAVRVGAAVAEYRTGAALVAVTLDTDPRPQRRPGIGLDVRRHPLR